MQEGLEDETGIEPTLLGCQLLIRQLSGNQVGLTRSPYRPSLAAAFRGRRVRLAIELQLLISPSPTFGRLTIGKPDEKIPVLLEPIISLDRSIEGRKN